MTYTIRRFPVALSADNGTIGARAMVLCQGTAMMTMLSPQVIYRGHAVKAAKVADLAQDMAERGWQGRALVVVETGAEEYTAVTGNHRSAAALKANLDSVPCVVLPAEYAAEMVNVCDEEALAVAERDGLSEVADLLRAECV